MPMSCLKPSAFGAVLALFVATTGVAVESACGMECVAHRGYWSDSVPENTVEAIRRAYAHGANWVETDFNIEKDGTVLCYHDAKRRDEVVRPPFHVPTLVEVLAEVPKGRGIQCEIKTYGSDYADKFDLAVKAAGLTESNVIVSSFNVLALEDFKKRKPAYRTLLLSGVNSKTTPEELIVVGRRLGVFAICPSAVAAAKCKWSKAEADRIRAAGFSFRLYGVNTPELLAYAASLGADAFTCNFFEDAFRWASASGVSLAQRNGNRWM